VSRNRSALPRLAQGRRRRDLGWLVATGCGQAAAAVLTALAMSAGLDGEAGWWLAGVLALLVVVAAAVGVLRAAERVLAERLSQDFVHQVRRELVAAELASERHASMGVTVTRASNDLTAVRNWVALGIAPMVVAVPVIAGCAVALAALDGWLAAAVIAPVLALVALLVVPGRLTYAASRQVRRARGRLAGQIADTVAAAPGVRSAGGQHRELSRVTRYSERLVSASLHRARYAGMLRGLAATAAAAVIPGVLAVAIARGLPAGTVAGALTVVGVLSPTLHDVGRVWEYRQSFRAARDVLVRVLADPPAPSPSPGDGHAGDPVAEVGLAVDGLVVRLEAGVEHPVPDIRAGPGSRILVEGDSDVVSALMATIAGARQPVRGSVRVNEVTLHTAEPRTRRALVGAVLAGQHIERGPLVRAVRYRVPEANEEDVAAALQRVGLVESIEALPDGPETRLFDGGRPLTRPQLTRLLLARATLGAPPLLVLDRIDGELGAGGEVLLSAMLDDCVHSVAVVATTRLAMCGALDVTQRWVLDPTARQTGTPRGAEDRDRDGVRALRSAAVAEL